MASIAVLPPQDCISDHLPRHRPLISPQMKKPNPNPARSNRRKRSPEKKTNNNKPRNAMRSYDSSPVKTLLTGQVKILKRGEETTPLKNLAGERKGRGSGDLEMTPKPMRIGDFYAGSAIITSPPPSSLPLPAFFTKKNVLGTNPNPNLDASADLRRLLRLDFM